MAGIIGKPVGKVAAEIASLESGQWTNSPLNKVWRAMILINRATSLKDKVSNKESKVSDAKNLHTTKTHSLAQVENPWTRMKTFPGVNPEKLLEVIKTDYTTLNQEHLEKIRNEIVIANLDSSPSISLVIQNRPYEVRFEPSSSWAVVKSMGRNLPFYFYTGGEDTISFDISWYSVDAENRDDVINKCKLLESWTKANGYSSSPPTLKIQWGNSDMFENDSFILTNAPYTLSHFQNSVRNGTYRHQEFGQRISDTGVSSGKVKDLKLLPNCATQTLTFKRVSSNNPTWEDIISSSKLERTPGINLSTNSNKSLENSVE